MCGAACARPSDFALRRWRGGAGLSVWGGIDKTRTDRTGILTIELIEPHETSPIVPWESCVSFGVLRGQAESRSF